MTATRAERSATVPAELVRRVDRTPLPEGVTQRFLALADLTPSVADALDQLGVVGSTATTTVVRAVNEGDRVVGPATTLRYTASRFDTAAARQHGLLPKLGDREAGQVALPGDVLVIDCQGNQDDAVIGDRTAERLCRDGVVGCVCDGAVRDVASLRRGPLQVWSATRSPRNALHRLETAEINGPVHIGTVRVEPGDLVAADDNGVAVVPRHLVLDVLALCEAQEAAERHPIDPPPTPSVSAPRETH